MIGTVLFSCYLWLEMLSLWGWSEKQEGKINFENNTDMAVCVSCERCI